MEILNQKIDLLFDQIADLKDRQQIEKAAQALILWVAAKRHESLGLGPTETQHAYKAAYWKLSALGLDVSGMIPPYDKERT